MKIGIVLNLTVVFITLFSLVGISVSNNEEEFSRQRERMVRDQKSKSENNLGAEKMLENLKRHTVILSKDIGERNFMQYQNLERAAGYIKQEFKNYGYQPQEQVYDLAGKTFRNIIAIKRGKVLANKIIVVCAHYDSVVGSPGADDNASGVAGLLELARLLSKEELKKTVKFIAFTNEEPPFYLTKDMGSFHYAQEAKRKSEDIEAVFCLESIGYYSDKRKSQGYPFGLSLFYPDRANFIAVAGNLTSCFLVKRIVKDFRKHSGFSIEYLVAPIFLAPAISFSDHASFWKFGYRATMITDTAFYRNSYYHTGQDTPEKLNYEYMAQVIDGLYKVIRQF